MLLVVLYFVVFNFVMGGTDYFIDFFKCFLNRGYDGLTTIECASFVYQYFILFLLLVFLAGIFVFSVYKTEKVELENKNKLSWVLRFNGAIMLFLFFLFFIFFSMDMSFVDMAGLPTEEDMMIGLPPQSRLSLLIYTALISLIFSFFSTLFFSYIPSRIKIKFLK